MSGFKGTKGKWEYSKSNTGSYIILVDNSYKGTFRDEYDALISSKAPEMLEMLEKIEHDLRHGYNIQSWVQIKIQQLIKSATEL